MQSASVGLRSAIEDGQADRGNQQHGKKGQLKAWSQERSGIENQQGEGSAANGIQYGAIAINETRAEIDRQHQRGAPNWCSDVGKKGVGDREKDDGASGVKVRNMEAAQDPEDDKGEDSDIHSRNDEDVVRAGA